MVPTKVELTRLTHTIARRVGRYLERQGLLELDTGNIFLTQEEISSVRPVTLDRDANMKMLGVDVGTFQHLREPTTPENQPVIRMNQDTLYSGAVLDLSQPVQISLPEAGGRYMSMHVVSQDHYMLFESEPGLPCRIRVSGSPVNLPKGVGKLMFYR